MKKKVFKQLIFAMAAMVCISACVTDKPEPTPEVVPTVWKVLWAICPEIDAEINGKRYQTSMTAEEIEIVKSKAAWFEEFVEQNADGWVDIQITTDVIRNTITAIEHNEETAWGFRLPLADRIRLCPEDNFDCFIYTADYTGIPINWRAITSWNTSWMVFCHTGGWVWEYGGFNPDATTKQYHRNVYVHEWCHQLEAFFPSLGEGYEMPVLHDDQSAYAYTEANTGLTGETRSEKWYADYIHGTIVAYPGATASCKGVHPDWWQYTPLSFREDIITMPYNYETGVEAPPTVMVKWKKPVEQSWSTGSFHVVLRDGETDVELGFYNVTNLMSADRMTLTIDFSQPLYRMWDNVYETINFVSGKSYRLTSYSLGYADFSITFTIK